MGPYPNEWKWRDCKFCGVVIRRPSIVCRGLSCVNKLKAEREQED